MGPILGKSNLMQMYGIFEEFVFAQCIVWVGSPV